MSAYSCRIVETELRKTSLDWHLATLEAYLVLVSCASLSSFSTACRSATFSGALTTAYSFSIVC